MFLFALLFLRLLGTIGATEEMVMGKIVLYLAMSVDGYLADQRGGVDWLVGDGSEPDAPGSYPVFLDTVDAIVMGWTTYHQLVTELSPDSWPYEGRPCYVVTHRKEENQEGIFFWNGELTVLVDQLKGEHEGNVWICGGASVAGQLLKEGRIDRLWLSIIPTVLGKGVRLFPELSQELPLRLVGTERWNGIVDLVYEKR
jgi:dihydrofolate reductase